MNAAEHDLFGEPACDLAQSQLFTPLAIARRMAGWILRTDRVVEPSCGKGNLIQGLLDVGHPPEQIVGVERDPRMADFARQRFGGRVEIHCADFFEWQPAGRFDAALLNPPFEDNQHMRFVLRCLKMARYAVCLVPVTFEYTGTRDRELWAQKGSVTRRALLPDRVKYAGAGGSFESCVLRIVRRMQSRRVGEERVVYEETWTDDDEALSALEAAR